MTKLSTEVSKRTAIFKIMQSRPDEAWRVQEICARLEQQGYDRHNTSGSLSKMLKDGHTRSAGLGLHQLTEAGKRWEPARVTANEELTKLPSQAFFLCMEINGAIHRAIKNGVTPDVIRRALVAAAETVKDRRPPAD